MAKNEGARASVEFICVFLVPDVCKSPTMPVPYKIYSLFDCAVNHSKNVKFRTRYAFHHKSRLATVRGDEAGVGGGILSGVNMGFCRPVPGTHSKSVRVNGTHVDYHRGTYMYMNCAGPEGQFNTIGKVLFLGNMLPGTVIKKDPAKEPPKAEEKSLLAKLREYVGDVESLIDKAKKLYEVAKTDWTNPASVLGAIGGLAGVAGYKEVSEYAKKAKEIYEKGKKVAEIDWSDPVKALGGIAGVAGMFGVEEVAKPANLGRTVGEAIKADWSKPKEALEAAKNLMKETGLNKVLAGLISDAITGDNTHSLDKTLPSLFPKPGQEKSPAEASKEPSDKKSDSEKDKSSSKDKKDDDSKKNTKFTGKDGILITTKQGNPTALAAAIEAAFREANAAALKKAQAEERKQQASVQDSPEASSESRTAEPQPTPTPRPQPNPTPTPAASANPSPDSTQTEPPTTTSTPASTCSPTLTATPSSTPTPVIPTADGWTNLKLIGHETGEVGPYTRTIPVYEADFVGNGSPPNAQYQSDGSDGKILWNRSTDERIRKPVMAHERQHFIDDLRDGDLNGKLHDEKNNELSHAEAEWRARIQGSNTALSERQQLGCGMFTIDFRCEELRNYKNEQDLTKPEQK